MKKNEGSTDDADEALKDSGSDGIREDEFVGGFQSELPSMAMLSAPSVSTPYASLPSASNVNDDDDRDVFHGRVSGTENLEHAPTGEPVPSTGLRVFDSLEMPPIVSASTRDVAPGAFAVSPSRNTGTRRTFRSPFRSYDSTGEATNEESKLEDGVTNSTGSYTGAHDNSGIAAGSGLYTVEAQRVPDGNEEGTIMVAEAQYVRLKWYQRPLYRRIFVCLALFACGLLGAVVVLVVIVNRPQSAASTSSLTSPTQDPIVGAPSTPDSTDAPNTPDPTTAPPTVAPFTGAPTTPESTAATPTPSPMRGVPHTSKPTSLTQVVLACNFLSIPNVTKCRSKFEFDSYFNTADTTTDSTIPSAIGLLTQLTWLDFYGNALSSTIPSEIGLLTRLRSLSFTSNLLTSSIPSEIGLLTQLTWLDFSNNALASTIPSEIELLTQLWTLSFTSNLLTSTIPSETGLLTQLTMLSFYDNSLTSTIPSEIGLLTKLTYLLFDSNLLKGTIPSSLCPLSSPSSSIRIDCGEITCDSGCCVDDTGSLCG